MSRRVFVVCLDTLGDQVLRQPLFSELLDAGWAVTALVRPGYAPLLPFLDPRLGVATADLDPFRPPEDARARLQSVLESLRADAPDLLAFPAFTRSYADEWLLRRAEGVSTAAFAVRPAPAVLAALARIDPSLDLEVPLHAALEIEQSEDAPEVDKNAALAAALTGRPAPRGEPRLTMGEDVRAEAAAFARSLGLTPGRYVIGCPAGAANNGLKAWPAEDYAALVVHLHRRHGLPVLLTGVASEADHLSEVARAAAAADVAAPVHLGEAADLPLLLGLAAHSRLYLGADTGPMHFAGALGVPVVAVFGGGHWPRFLPRAKRSFVATQKLPCFGCGWECWLREPACVRAVETDVVREGLDWILGEGPDERRVHGGAALGPVAERVLQGALAVRAAQIDAWARALQRVQQDAADRLRVIEDQGRQLQAQDEARRRDVEELTGLIRAREADAAARLRNMETLEAIIGDLRRVIDGQQAVLSRRSVKLLRLLRLA